MAKRKTLKQQVNEMNLILIAMMDVLGVTPEQLDVAIAKLLNPPNEEITKFNEEDVERMNKRIDESKAIPKPEETGKHIAGSDNKGA